LLCKVPSGAKECVDERTENVCKCCRESCGGGGCRDGEVRCRCVRDSAVGCDEVGECRGESAKEIGEEGVGGRVGEIDAFTAKRLVFVALVMLAFTAKRLLLVAFVNDALVANRFVVVALVSDAFTAKRLVLVALVRDAFTAKRLVFVALVKDAFVADRLVVVALVMVALSPTVEEAYKEAMTPVSAFVVELLVVACVKRFVSSWSYCWPLER
jgi:hypothetical protein